ncbi:MAG: RIP metalloprotease RseP, partial [Bacteroidota bacterium]
MEILVKAGQLVLSLSILIVLHEMGHFLPAKWFKTKVEKFYLFFDPWFSVFKKKIGETEYGIGWLPLGGYVKIAGMIDESFDTEQMKEPPKPWEFRSKPAWQRLIIMLGGVTVNFLLGFFIFAMILWTWGDEWLPTRNAIYGVQPDTLGMQMGIQRGDKVLAVGDTTLVYYNPNLVRNEIIIHDAKTIEIYRNGENMTLPVSKKIAAALSKYENKDYYLFAPLVPFVVDEFPKKSPAEAAGIRKGDQIIALNGKPTPFFNDFVEEVTKNPQKEKEIKVTAIRTDSTTQAKDTMDFTVMTDASGKIGAGYEGLPTVTITYGFLQSFPLGIAKGWKFLGDQVTAFGKMFSGEIKATDSLGSFITIGSMYPSTWDWERFWQMTAILSLVLAF